MSNKHEMKLLDNEINTLRNQVFYLNDLLDKITEWLENKADDDYGSGIDDLIVSLEAKDLLEQIKKWEEE